MLANVCASTQAQTLAEPPVLEFFADQQEALSIGPNMLYLSDHDRSMNIEQAMYEGLSWQTIHKASPNFGFTNSAYWFRFTLLNTSPETERVLIELPIPFLDDIHLYRVSDGEVLENHQLGDLRPFQERPILHQNFVMPFSLEPGKNDMILRVASQGTVEAPLFVWSPDAFTASTANDRLIQGVWFGVILIMVIYNLFLYVLLRDVSYLYYVSFAFSYMMFQACLKGYAFAYLWPESIIWNSYALPMFISLCSFFAFMLVSSFLDLKQHNPWGNRLIQIMAGVSFCLALASFILPYSDIIRISSAMTAVTCIISLSMGYWSWYNENRYAKYFCLAWTSAFGGIGILVSAKFGILPANFWTENSGQLGVMTLVALLSFALANRFNREKELRIAAQDQSLQHERLARHSQEELLRSRADATRKLEKKVAERTEKLERAMSELEAVNQRLEVMSTTDSLTELYNRRYFEESLSKEFEQARKENTGLAIILCDVDHFKMINDSFGHKAGDECLHSLAQLFKRLTAAHDGLVARYGGEEFIFLLKGINLKQAEDIASTVCQEVRSLNFYFNAKPIPLTASFGVASLCSQHISADQVVTQADLALYRAKNSGRDRVVCWQQQDENNTAKAN